jgi:ABC-type multidrug transport system fused ATPase/permease subunit
MDGKRENTLKLIIKAFKEVASSDRVSGTTYPILKIALVFIEIYQIFIMGRLIDSMANYIENHSAFNINEFISSDAFKTLFIILLVFLVYRAIRVGISHTRSRLWDFFMYKAKKLNIEKMSELNLEDIEKSDLQNLLTSVPSYSFHSTWDTYIRTTDFINNIINLVSAGYIIITQMSWWGVIVVFFVLPEALTRHNYNKKQKEFYDKNMEKQKYFEYLYTQSRLLNNFPELRVDNVFDFFKQSYKRAAKPYYEDLNNNIRRKRDIWHFLLSWFDGTLRSFMQILLVPIAVVRQFTIGKFKYLFDYIENLYSSSWQVVWNFLMIKYRLLYVKDYFDLKEYQGFGDISSGNMDLDPLRIPKIEFVNVSFQYPNSSSAALNNISFTIEPGEKVAIIGYDNSGKSTIAKLISGLYQIGPGDILIDDISITNLKRGELKDRMAVVFENYVKYKFSIRKNITVSEPNRDFNRRKYEEALEVTGLDKWMKEQELDDSQILGKLFSNGTEISSGHWQRLAIARALYRDRAILVLDESLTQIDGFSRRPILSSIMSHRPKQTLIHICQEEDNKDLFDKLIYLEKGEITKIIKNGKIIINNKVETRRDNKDKNKITKKRK